MDFVPFSQTPPELGNQYDDDPALRSYLRRALPADVLDAIEPDLREMGELSGGELYRMQLEDRLNEPVLTQWDAWGERIDRIDVTDLWRRAEAITVDKGVVATAYERAHGRFSRPHQFALVHLFSASNDFYSCPLAMTDGAAYTLRKSGNEELIGRALPHLTSRDPKLFWTSGQWMTEATGGSDVGASESVAQKDGKTWRLYGRKYFTSATTSQMALTLARPDGNGPGGRGLAMYYLELRDQAGRLHQIEVNRLKDKMGTRKVPTAELMLRGAPARLVSGTTGGVKHITPMLTITRTWNSIVAASLMRRGIALARDFAGRRVAFGARLSEKPLHVDTLAGLQAEYEGALQLSFFLTELLGWEEGGDIDEHRARLLRLLTPVTKLITGKQAVSAVSEAIECFGGAGYMEDTGLGLLMRDTQVLPIWEGTTNVLALDTLRALGKDPECLAALSSEVGRCAAEATEASLAAAGKQAVLAVERASAWLRESMGSGPATVEAGARRFALTIGRATELALLVRQAQWSLDHESDPRPAAAARRFALHGVDALAPMHAGDAGILAE